MQRHPLTQAEQFELPAIETSAGAGAMREDQAPGLNERSPGGSSRSNLRLSRFHLRKAGGSCLARCRMRCSLAVLCGGLLLIGPVAGVSAQERGSRVPSRAEESASPRQRERLRQPVDQQEAQMIPRVRARQQAEQRLRAAPSARPGRSGRASRARAQLERQRLEQDPGATLAKHEALIGSDDPQQQLRGYFARGSDYRDLKQYDKAIADFQRALDINPENSHAYLMLTMCYEAAKRPLQAALALGWSNYYGQAPDRAIEAFSRALQLDRSSAEALLGLGLSRINYGQEQSGERDLVRALQLDRRCVRGYTARGQHRMRNGQLAAALADFDLAVELEPQNPHVRLRRAQALLAANQPARAAEDLALYVARFPTQPEARLQLAAAQAASSQLDAAVATTSELTIRFPRHLRGWLQHATVLAKAGKIDQAMQSVEQAIAIDGDNADALFARAVLKLSTSDNAGLSDLTRAVRYDARYAPSAARIFKRIIEEDPASKAAHHGLAIAHYQLGEYQQAREALNQTSGSALGQGLLHYDRGMVLQRLDRHRDAINAFTQSIRHGGAFSAAHLGRGRSQSALGNHAAAIRDYARVNRGPLENEARKHRAAAYHAQGKVEEAMFELQRLHPKDHETHFMHALLLARTGDKAAANRALREASRLAPHNPRYQQFYKTSKDSPITVDDLKLIGAGIAATFALVLIDGLISGDTRVETASEAADRWHQEQSRRYQETWQMMYDATAP